MHRRGPQRQVSGLRSGERAGDRASPDRDVLAADPYRRPCRGAATRRLRRARRLPRPHLGGHRHRGAEAARDPVHRRPRAIAAALVRRRHRLPRVRRQHEYRAHAAHGAGQGRRCRGAGRGDPAVRVRPRGGRGGDAAEGVRANRRDSPRRPHAGTAGRGGHGSSRRRPAGDDGRSRGLVRATRWQATSGAPAPR